ncbi:hypothetical protein [Streptomyces sp. NPDC060184]|uniref:hypothetical protein n=1 Tax=Streptomyces sp. NPDC060184 TaxID=3347064 RepID=UPI0036476D2E
MLGTIAEAVENPLAGVLESDPARTAVLEAAGLVRREGDAFTPHSSLVYTDRAGWAGKAARILDVGTGVGAPALATPTAARALRAVARAE